LRQDADVSREYRKWWCRSDRAARRPQKRAKNDQKIIEPVGGVGIFEFQFGCIRRWPVIWARLFFPCLHPPGNSHGMPLAHHPDSDEVDCLLRNCELRNEIEPYLDEAIWEIDFRLLPTAVENRFLESMLAWERAPLVPIARWFEPPMALQPACTLDDDQLRERLWETIEKLYSQRVVLDFTDHLPDRELYALIRRDILPATVKRVDLPDNYFHWDCSTWDCGARESGTTDAEDATVWLIYYATDEEREQWSLEEGRDPPPRAVPPYPRALPTAPV
jgi:hypothetical protein